MSNIDLKEMLVKEIQGVFYLPKYQRGYRWIDEVKMLLNDIKELPEGETNKYWLQPIVVKRIEDGKYELIDGQQRLTTIFLILKYVYSIHPKAQINFSLEYETRKHIRNFLDGINANVLGIEPRNVDEYHIIEAYKIITDWFNNKNNESGEDDELLAALNFYGKLYKQVRVIWYEVDTDEPSEALFTRLNIGRIPLTNAELVKALFLSRKSGIDDSKQREIAMQWDIIERDMRNDSFWYFLTNNNSGDYPTRIELLFDLMAEKSQHKGKFRTFFYFSDEIKDLENSGGNRSEEWTRILRCYQRLKGWYEVTDLYHKIGYLIAIASEKVNMGSLIKKAEELTKSEFEESLKIEIANSIKINKDYLDLSYEIKEDYKNIERILLLFNVETIRQMSDEAMRFPFEKHKKNDWTLEHIHARRSEGLNKKEQWQLWLKDHKKSLESISQEKHKGLIADITVAIADDKLSREQFDKLSEIITDALSEDNGEIEYVHSLSNMALLGFEDNATLNNSTFSVKRSKVLELDKVSAYIPECTRRVFLKYYTKSSSAHLHYWGPEDREGYLSAMHSLIFDEYGLELLPNKPKEDRDGEDNIHE